MKLERTYVVNRLQCRETCRKPEDSVDYSSWRDDELLTEYVSSGAFSYYHPNRKAEELDSLV